MIFIIDATAMVVGLGDCSTVRRRVSRSAWYFSPRAFGSRMQIGYKPPSVNLLELCLCEVLNPPAVVVFDGGRIGSVLELHDDVAFVVGQYLCLCPAMSGPTVVID